MTQTRSTGTGLSLNAAPTARSSGSSIGLLQLFPATQLFSQQSDPGLRGCAISELTWNVESQTLRRANGEEVVEPVGAITAVTLRAGEDT